MLKSIGRLLRPRFIVKIEGLTPDMVARIAELTAGVSSLTSFERLKVRIGLPSRHLIVRSKRRTRENLRLICAHSLQRGAFGMDVTLKHTIGGTLVEGVPSGSLWAFFILIGLWILLLFHIADDNTTIIVTLLLLIIGLGQYFQRVNALLWKCKAFFEDFPSPSAAAKREE